MSEYPFVSIIIPTYNRARLLPITLDSMLAQDYPADRFEIVVANDNSSDNTLEVLQGYADKYANVTFLTEPSQCVHLARNAGGRASRGSILYFTDDDMIAEKDMLRHIVSIFAAYPKVASVTGKVLPKWEAEPPEWVLEHMQNAYLSLNDLGEETLVSEDDIGVFSCHQAVRRDVFFEAGGFNPELFGDGQCLGDGETGLNIKIKKLGYSFGYVGASVTNHIIPPRRMTQEYLNKRLAIQGNCDAYTEHKRDGMRTMHKRIVRQLFQLLKTCASSFIGTLKGRNDFFLRHKKAYIYYYINKIRYNIILICSKERRKLVARDNWIY